jgi:hypothetical protein
MTNLYHLTVKSGNAKTGPIPVSTSSAALCPATCPFNNGGGCYAASGPLALHWAKVTTGQRGTEWPAFTASIARLPQGQLWRHNQSGDLLDPGTSAGAIALAELTTANHGRRGYTYTHHALTPMAIAAIRSANLNGFTVNVSTETESAADDAIFLGLPAVLTVDTAPARTWKTEAGNTVVQCPATVDGVTTDCATCQLCHHRKADVIIAFPVHGTGKKKAAASIAARQQ